MTRTTNARIAGFTFLAYIVAGVASMVVSGRATAGGETAAKLASIASHANEISIVVLLGFVQAFSALVLGVTLYAITRDQDAELAMLAMLCRVGEGLVGSLSIPEFRALQWLATDVAAATHDDAAAQLLGMYLLRGDMAFTATFFAVGSALFCWLLLRGRTIPAGLAWLGVAASLLLVVVLPLQLAGLAGPPLTMIVWLPMLAFEVPLAFWLMVKGVGKTGAESPA